MIKRTLGQLARYGLSGIVINALLYAFYLILTQIGVLPWQAATVAFAVGVPTSYIAHRRYTFQNARSSRLRRLGFAAAYVSAYFLQIGGLYLLYNVNHIPHQIAQITMTVVVAAWLFFIQKFVIFKVEYR